MEFILKHKMSTFKPVDEQMDLLEKGAAEIIRVSDLRERLEESRKTGRPLRVKAGFDPTAPDLHLGHTVLMRKLRHFQQLGHTVIFLVGDFTSLIGDPTGRNVTRKPLTRAEIDENAKTYKEQVFRILDEKATEVRYNSEWLGKLGYEDTVAADGAFYGEPDAGARRFLKRFQAEQPISLHELLYPVDAGIRLRVPGVRCGAGRDGPEIQSAVRARTAAAVRAEAADRADDADSGGSGRRAEDVEVSK